MKAADTMPMFVMGALFVVVDLLAFVVTGPFEAAGVGAFENPGDWGNLVFFFVVLVVFTAFILVIAKYGKKHVIQGIFLGSTGLLGVYVLYPLLSIILPWEISLGVAVAAMAVLTYLLIKYPEWYILDITGVMTAVGAVAMLGISLTVLIVVALLIVMATYDAISVYKTKHMIDLADVLVDLKLPILFVIPKKRGYSLINEEKNLKEKIDSGEEREAFFLGVGDTVFPGILAVAAYYTIGGMNGFLIGLSIMIGTLIGFAGLMVFVIKGKPQAGLPFLCPGAILGYVISSLLLTGGLAGFGL
ncbi:MAG: presenilin family intramembrane aspartyl protease [Candidatus Bathyarchaeota archaeon]|nr:presenilin family intramembrane aspartyl protease [Candidatus Bathyarchaeota archaeon]